MVHFKDLILMNILHPFLVCFEVWKLSGSLPEYRSSFFLSLAEKISISVCSVDGVIEDYLIKWSEADPGFSSGRGAGQPRRGCTPQKWSQKRNKIGEPKGTRSSQEGVHIPCTH